jgi:hypothetical protein
MSLMTETTARRRAGILARMPAWIGRRQRELSDRVHAAGDECARLHGWEVTKSTGRFGFGARTYRDPRFDDRRRQFLPPAGGSRSHSQAVPAAAPAAVGDTAGPSAARGEVHGLCGGTCGSTRGACTAGEEMRWRISPTI